ncbi:MAG TPA: MFS transporter [Solirubrobacteraceae bacterium]|nr:MFS transporter [Solirubrobacteraceae bacterium]
MPGLRQLMRVLRHRDFRLLWLGNSASVVGDRIVTVAIALFVIDLTGSAVDLGFVMAAYSLPLIFFLLVGGVFADRLPRHLVVVTTDLVRFALHGALALLIVTGEVRIWHLVVIGVLFGSAEAFYRPAASGLLPQTVPEDEIQEANAVTTMFANIAEFAGPALATVLVLGFSPAAAFGIDALTFLVSAALLVRISPRDRAASAKAAESASTAPAAPASVWADVRIGFAEVRSRAWVWATLAAFCIALFCAIAPLFVIGPIVAKEQYGDLAVFGYVFAAFGAGTVAGSFASLRWRPRYPMRQAMTCILLWPGAIALFAIGAPLGVVLPAMVVSGTGASLFDVLWLTALAERIPPDKLSRVTSYDWTVSLGLVPLGYVLAGPAAEAFGATEVLLGGAAVAFVALGLGLLPRETRMLERRDDPAAPFALPDARAHAHPQVP